MTRELEPFRPGWGKEPEWGADYLEERLSVSRWIFPCDQTMQEDIHMWAHCGTHVEGHYHLHKHGEALSDYPLEHFFGEAVFADLSYVDPAVGVRAADLERFEGKVAEGDIFIPYGDYMGRSADVTLEAAEWLAGKRIKAFGWDGTVVLPTPSHNLLLENDVLEISKLDKNGVRAVNAERAFVIAAVLRIKGMGASPARVLAFEE
ncbi:MAG: cyclase family protein [Candidatus Bathyarchaeia archaeon]